MMYYNVIVSIGQAKSSHKVQLLAGIVLLLLQGCSAQAWYEGFRERERSRCYEQITTDEIEACLEQVETISYDRYRRSRQEKPVP